MQANDTVIQFSGLKPGRYTYQYTLDDTFFQAFENDDLQKGTVTFDVEMEKKESIMLFHFSFRGTICTTCDRCLGEMTVSVEGDRHMCVKLSDEREEDDEETTIVPMQTTKIDLAQWMYEYVLMAMPMRCVHDEADCDPAMLQRLKGQNEDENETPADPRWNALLKL